MNTFLIGFSGISLTLALAQSPGQATFSPEFEFTNPKITGDYYGDEGQLHIGDENLKVQEKWAELMEKLCKKRNDCTVEERYDSEYAYEYEGEIMQDFYHPDYRVKYKDGFYFDITLDPTVIEVKVKPGTLADFKKNRDRIQEDIFDFAANELKIRPPKEAGGHIHMGALSAFGSNMKLLRNYIVDIMNHQELWLLMGEDFRNAPPLALLGDGRHQAYLAIIADLDSGKISDFSAFGKRMRKEVYDETYDRTVVSEWDKAYKYHAINVNRMSKKFTEKQMTIEHRGFPVQGNVDEFLLWIELIQKRLDYLKKVRGKIAIKKFDLSGHTKWVKQFKDYVEETGLKFGDYQPQIVMTPKAADRCSAKLKRAKNRS